MIDDGLSCNAEGIMNITAVRIWLYRLNYSISLLRLRFNYSFIELNFSPRDSFKDSFLALAHVYCSQTIISVTNFLAMNVDQAALKELSFIIGHV